MSSQDNQNSILPGNWIGVLGGGQLGRMLTHAAQEMGYHVAVFDPEPNCPAAQAADRHFCCGHDSRSEQELVEEMSQLCDVITLEFENIPSELVRLAAENSRTCPGAEFLEVCQDRLREKSSLSAAGFPTTPFLEVNSAEDVLRASQTLAWPVLLKTARSGYDGKGQILVRSADELEQAWKSLETTQVIAEKWIEFDAEVSVITARNALGQIVCYPLFENHHANHILDITRCPASLHLRALEPAAHEICKGIAERFNVVGLFCVEFFATNTGDLVINEMAPRPHNSGHLTIEAFTCSQFEQQVRAICNLPLAPANLLTSAAMANILGDLWEGGEPQWPEILAHPAARLHLYGKAEPRAARKMGHITVLDESPSEAALTAKELRDKARRSIG